MTGIESLFDHLVVQIAIVIWGLVSGVGVGLLIGKHRQQAGHTTPVAP